MPGLVNIWIILNNLLFTYKHFVYFEHQLKWQKPRFSFDIEGQNLILPKMFKVSFSGQKRHL
jgi:hypothetical protein